MPSVLIVDDALFMRTTIANLFNQWGFQEIYKASNGKEAIELYKQHKPNLVTMDVTMPTMTGLEASKKILEFDPKANIIMVTALGQQRLIVEAIESGVKDFITKPFEPQQLKNVVNNVLDIYID